MNLFPLQELETESLETDGIELSLEEQMRGLSVGIKEEVKVVDVKTEASSSSASYDKHSLSTKVFTSSVLQ